MLIFKLSVIPAPDFFLNHQKKKGGFALKKALSICFLAVILVLSLTNTEAVVFKPGFGATASDYLKWPTPQRTKYVVGFYDGLCAGPLVLYERSMYLGWFVEMPQLSSAKLESIITAYLKKNPQRWNEPLNILAYNALNQSFNVKARDASEKEK